MTQQPNPLPPTLPPGSRAIVYGHTYEAIDEAQLDTSGIYRATWENTANLSTGMKGMPPGNIDWVSYAARAALSVPAISVQQIQGFPITSVPYPAPPASPTFVHGLPAALGPRPELPPTAVGREVAFVKAGMPTHAGYADRAGIIPATLSRPAIRHGHPTLGTIVRLAGDGTADVELAEGAQVPEGYDYTRDGIRWLYGSTSMVRAGGVLGAITRSAHRPAARRDGNGSLLCCACGNPSPYAEAEPDGHFTCGSCRSYAHL